MEVTMAIKGHLQQIRHIANPDEKDKRVIAAVTFLAKAYGTRHDISRETLDEAADFIIEQFYWLGVDEIQTAFRWHASGKIETKAGEMYGGVFNVRALGAILTEYNNVRKKIVAQYLEAVAKEEAAKEEAARKAKQKADFEKNLLASVDRARAQKLPWKSIPADWHDWLKKRGKLKYTDEEKRKAWEDAKDEIETEKAEERKEAMIGDKISRVVALKAIGRQDDDARRIQLAKKLLVYRKLMK
jgi:hypothetical protein